MSTTTAQTYRNNYDALVKENDTSKITEVFGKAKFVQFSKDVTIQGIEEEQFLRFYLGFANNALQAIIVKKSDDLKGTALADGKYIMAEFKNTTCAFNVAEGKAQKAHQITKSEYETRTTKWSKEWMDIVTSNLKSRTLVQYFEIPAENFKNGILNNFVFGIKTSVIEEKNVTHIDLISIQDDVYMNVARPVPPFKPGW